MIHDLFSPVLMNSTVYGHSSYSDTIVEHHDMPPHAAEIKERGNTDSDGNNELERATIQQFTRLGAKHLKLLNFKKAQIAFEHAFRKSINQKDNATLNQKCALNLAAVYIAQGRAEKAVHYLQLASPLAEVTGCAGDYHYNAAIAHENMGNLQSASAEFCCALKEYKAENASPDIIANVAMKTGLVHMKLHKNSQAAASFDTAIEIYSSQSLVSQLAIALCMKGSCLAHTGDKSAAIETCRESVGLSKGLTQDKFLGEARFFG